MWRMALLLAACGRLDFGAVPDAPPLVAPRPLAEQLPCTMPMLLDGGGHLPHDTLAYVHELSGQDWLVGVAHTDQDNHDIERHALTIAGGLVAAPAEHILHVDHVDILAFEPIGDRFVLGYPEFVLGTAATAVLGPGLVPTSNTGLGMLAQGNPPLARAGTGGLVMVGITGGDLQVLAIDDDGNPAGATNHLATQAEAPAAPTLIATDTGLAVVWGSGPRNACRIALLAPDLSIAAGPVDMMVDGCNDAHLAWLPASRRLVAVASGNAGVFAAVWSDTLAPLQPPAMLAPSARWIRIAGDDDGAWVAWLEGSKARPARIDHDAHITQMGGAVGELDGTLGHYHTLQRVGTAAMLLWTDQAANRTFSAMRVCL